MRKEQEFELNAGDYSEMQKVSGGSDLWEYLRSHSLRFLCKQIEYLSRSQGTQGRLGEQEMALKWGQMKS